MKPDLEFIILSSLTIIAFIVNIKYGILMLLFFILTYTCSFYLTTQGVIFDVKNLEVFFYYKPYEEQNSYKNVFTKLKEFSNIERKFKGKKIEPAGYFLDDPVTLKKKKKEKIVKAFIGFISEIDLGKVEDFQRKKITESVVAGNYNSFFSLKRSFIFINKLIVGNVLQKLFCRLYNPGWKEKTVTKSRNIYKKKTSCFVVLEDYNVNLYLPVEESFEFN